jgi:hypothetical protein
MDAEGAQLARFLAGEIAAVDFPHREHVRMAYAMLRRHEFAEVALHYSRALRAMTQRAGRPEAFNLTLTIALLALIAQRMAEAGEEDFASFAAANPDLFQRGLLERWYTPERLNSPLARRSFLLPDSGASCRDNT